MWALGAVFTGVSFNYGWLLFARIFTGAGALQCATCLQYCMRMLQEHSVHAVYRGAGWVMSSAPKTVVIMCCLMNESGQAAHPLAWDWFPEDCAKHASRF